MVGMYRVTIVVLYVQYIHTLGSNALHCIDTDPDTHMHILAYIYENEKKK